MTESADIDSQFKRAIDMTDDELAAIVAKARLTVIKCSRLSWPC
jgi:hypothetical protein